MKGMKKIFLCAFLVFVAISLYSCGKKTNEYKMEYEVIFTDSEVTIDKIISEYESKNNVDLSNIEFSVTNSNNNVLEIANNQLSCKEIGSSEITLKSKDTIIKVNVSVKPEMVVYISSTMKEGNSQNVSVKFKPSTYTESFTITSSNQDVISVYNDTKLKGESLGTSLITITTESGLKHEVEITVEEVLYNINFDIDDELEEFLVGDLPEKYAISMLPMELPTIERPGYYFYGWQINPISDGYDLDDLHLTLPKNIKGNVKLRPIVLRSSLEIEYETESIVKPNESINLIATPFNVGKDAEEVVWESKNQDIATVDQNGKVTGLTEGVVEIFAYLKKLPDINMTVFVTVDKQEYAHVELLDYLKSIAINEIIVKPATVVSFTGNYNVYLYSAVSTYLFEDLKIIEQITDASMSNRPGDIYEKKYITVHDTANGGVGANAQRHAGYVNGGGEGTSWHYSVGNDGIYHQIPDNEKAYHAGDGSRPYKLYETGVVGTNKYPEVTISKDGFYELDGVKTKVEAPKKVVNGKESIPTTSDINDFGIRVILEDGKYYIGNTYYNDTYHKISNGGGNNNAIGIEMCVDKGSDIYYTWQKNAKLVAKLLRDNNLTIDDVKPHHFFSGKDCPATMLHAEMWDLFIEMIKTEYKMLTEYSGYKITFTSSNENFLTNTGKVKARTALSRSVSYTITVEKDGIVDSITLSTIIPGSLATK